MVKKKTRYVNSHQSLSTPKSVYVCLSKSVCLGVIKNEIHKRGKKSHVKI